MSNSLAMKITYDQFYSAKGKILSFSEMVVAISEFVEDKKNSQYTLIIGSDSQSRSTNNKHEIDYVTAVIIYRNKKGARFFYAKSKEYKKPILRDKIYTETMMSLTLAGQLVPLIRERIPEDKCKLEIHVDVGPSGKTRVMIKEIVGMVTGSGYTVKTKPDSWGASSVADRYA